MIKSLTVLLLLATAQSESHTQSSAPIKVEVPNVVVDVIVTDKKGHSVSSLTKEQFTVLEDGVSQEIAAFTAPDTRQNVASPQDVRPNAGSAPEAPKAGLQRGRKPQSITLLIDLGDIQSTSLTRTCDAAAKYVEKSVAAGNQIAIYWVDSSLHLAVPFSSDKQRLQEALQRLSTRVPNGQFTARDRIKAQQRIDDLWETIHTGPGDPMKKGLVVEMNTLRSWLVTASTFQARSVFVALRALALAYRDLPGRKSVVLFSEGFLHAPDAGGGMQAVIDAANRAGVSFYVIDSLGNDPNISADTRTLDPTGHRSDPNPAVDGFAVTMGQDVFDWVTTLTSDVHSDLGNVAHATGGFLVTNTDNLLRAMERVELDGSEYYSLVYHPTNRNYDGAFRKIKVTLDGGGYRLRFRQGYWGIPPGREVMMTPGGAQLLAAVQNGSQKPSFVPEVRAAFVQSRQGGFAVPVAVSLPGTEVPFEKKKDLYSAGVTLLLVARDAEGQLVSLYERYGDLRFDKTEWESFRQKTFNLNGHMPVPSLDPLTVQAIVQFSSGAIGMSTQSALTVPDSDPGLTSLVLSNHVEPADCGADLTDPLCLKTLRVYVPARAHFVNADRLTLYFTVLNLAPDPQTKQPSVRATFDLIQDEKSSALHAERIQSVTGSSAGSLMVLAAFNLRHLQPGRYRLQANVEDVVRHAKSSGRVDFLLDPPPGEGEQPGHSRD